MRFFLQNFFSFTHFPFFAQNPSQNNIRKWRLNPKLNYRKWTYDFDLIF